MTKRQINTIANMLTGDPDIFTEGSMSTSSMSGAPSISSPIKRTADAPTDTDIDARIETDKPLDTLDMEKQADEMSGGDQQTSNMLADQLKAQDEMQHQHDLEQQKIMKPQYDELNTVMANLQSGVLQGKQAVSSNNQQFGDLDRNMADLNTLLRNLQKQQL